MMAKTDTTNQLFFVCQRGESCFGVDFGSFFGNGNTEDEDSATGFFVAGVVGFSGSVGVLFWVSWYARSFAW